MMLLMNKKGGIDMKKEEKKVDFNLSVLKLDELIKVFDDVSNFIKYLNDKKIVIEEKVKGSDE
jgi:hypothetical protein